MILITGATGTTGTELVKLLSAKGIKTRAMTRDPGRAARIKLPNIEIVKGDLDKPPTLEKALEGIDKVFLLSSADPRLVKLEGNMIKAAAEKGIKHLVRFSAFGVSPDSYFTLAKNHWAVEELVEKSGIPYTILKPNYFMQNLFMFSPNIIEQGMLFLPLGEAKISMVDVRDIAAVALEVLTGKGHEGKKHEITGPAAITFTDVAGILSTVTENPIKYVDVPPEDARKAMLDSGMSRWFTDAILGLYAAFREGHFEPVRSTVKDITGKDPIDFETFAKEFRHAFIAGEGKEKVA